MTLDVQRQMLIEQRVANDGKSAVVAYLLLIFFGGLGLHRFYLGRTGSGLAMLALSVLGILGLTIVVGALLLIVVGIWMLIDLFLIPGMVAGYRDGLRDRLIRDAELGAAALAPQQAMPA